MLSINRRIQKIESTLSQNVKEYCLIKYIGEKLKWYEDTTNRGRIELDKPPIIKNEIKLTAFIMSKTNVFFIPAKKILAKNPIRLDKLIKDMLSKSTDKKNLKFIEKLFPNV